MSASMQTGSPSEGTSAIDPSAFPDLNVRTISSFPYSVVLADFDGNTILMLDTATDAVVTVPTGIPAKHPLFLTQIGLGKITVEQGAACIVNSPNGYQLVAQYSGCALVPMSPNVYQLFGDLANAP